MTVAATAPQPNHALGARRVVHQRDNTLLLEERGEDRPETPLLDPSFAPGAAVAFLGDFHLFEALELVVVVAPERLLRGVDLCRIVEQHHGPRELAPPAIQILLVPEIGAYRPSADGPVGSRRPRLCGIAASGTSSGVISRTSDRENDHPAP